MSSTLPFPHASSRLLHVDYMDWTNIGLLSSSHSYWLGFTGQKSNVSSELLTEDTDPKVAILLGNVATLPNIRRAELVTHGPMEKFNVYTDKRARWHNLQAPIEQELSNFIHERSPIAEGIAVHEQGDIETVRRVLAEIIQRSNES